MYLTAKGSPSGSLDSRAGRGGRTWQVGGKCPAWMWRQAAERRQRRTSDSTVLAGAGTREPPLLTPDAAESRFPPGSSYSLPEFGFCFDSPLQVFPNVSHRGEWLFRGGGATLWSVPTRRVLGPRALLETEKESELSSPPSKAPALQQCTSYRYFVFLAGFCFKKSDSPTAVLHSLLSAKMWRV